MEIRLPIIHFPVRTVSFREGIMYMYVCPTKNVPWNSPNMPAELEKNLWWFYQWPDHVILSMFGTCRKGQWSTGRERNFQQKVAVPCSQWCKCCWFNWPPVTELGWLEDDSPLLGIYCMIYMFSFKCIVYILSHKCHVFIQLIYLIQTTALLDELFINQEAMHVQTKHWVDYGDPKTNQELQMGMMFEGWFFLERKMPHLTGRPGKKNKVV